MASCPITWSKLCGLNFRASTCESDIGQPIASELTSFVRHECLVEFHSIRWESPKSGVVPGECESASHTIRLVALHDHGCEIAIAAETSKRRCREGGVGGAN